MMAPRLESHTVFRRDVRRCAPPMLGNFGFRERRWCNTLPHLSFVALPARHCVIPALQTKGTSGCMVVCPWTRHLCWPPLLGPKLVFPVNHVLGSLGREVGRGLESLLHPRSVRVSRRVVKEAHNRVCTCPVMGAAVSEPSPMPGFPLRRTSVDSKVV